MFVINTPSGNLPSPIVLLTRCFCHDLIPCLLVGVTSSPTIHERWSQNNFLADAADNA
jgi:hypothetical protein